MNDDQKSLSLKQGIKRGDSQSDALSNLTKS
jgi:hypothetical protein